MDIIISNSSGVPIYEQIVEKFRMLILSGAVEPSSKMPSVRQLAVELSINPNTIQRAYTELERQGYIYSIKGKGSFVADNSRMKAGILQEWKGHFNSAVEEGIKVGVTAGEMKEMIDTACRNHAMERGESND